MKLTNVKFLVLSLFGLLSITLTAQTLPKITPITLAEDQETRPIGFCASEELKSYYDRLDPNRQTREQFEAQLAPFIKKIEEDRAAGRNIQVSYNIPVVIHVIHDGDALGTGENITDAQAISQINVLNLAFNNMGSTTYNNTGVNFDIHFCIAQTDPNGVATTGVEHIVRVPPTDTYPNSSYGPTGTSSEKDWETNAQVATVKSATSWDPTKYMNFWTFRLANNGTAGSPDYGSTSSGGVLGFATFPNMPNSSTPADLPTGTGNASVDGSVSVFDGMGTISDPAYQSSWLLNPNWNTGKTMVHEVGHWLGLYHTFQGGCASPGDYCNDTPQSNGAPAACTASTNTCPSDPGNDPIHNHMSYTGETCRNEYTPNQITRAQAVMANGYRRSTLNASTKCQTATPIIKYEKTTGAIDEGTNCNYTDTNFKIFIGKGASQKADITFNVTGGTATQALDYQIIPATVSFTAGSLTAQNMTIRVFHDGIVEGGETINVSLVLNANGGDATLDPAAKDMVITINDNDVTPTAVVTTTLLTEDFEDSSDWSQIDGDADGVGFQFSNFASGAIANLTNIAAVSITDKTIYSQTGSAAPNHFLISKQITIPTGVDSATLTYRTGAYTQQGGTTYQENYSVYFASDISSAATISATTGTRLLKSSIRIPVNQNAQLITVDLTSLIGQTGYLVFRHHNTAPANGLIAFDTVNLTTSKTTSVQTAVNTPTAYNALIPQTGTANATDTTSGNIMLSITNTDNINYGCATVSVSRDAAAAGAPAVNYGANTANNLKVTAKRFTITTGTANTTSSNTLTFYFTDAELSAWETATGNVRANIKALKAGDATYSNVTIGAFATNVTLTATFSTGLAGDYYFGVPPSPPTAVATTTVNETCGSANGSITIGAVTGGSAPYTFSVNGSPFTATTSYPNLAAGTYSIIVKDANGATYTTSVTITNTAGPTAVATTKVNTTCGATNGSVTIGAVTGGTAPYTYSFNGSAFTSTTNYPNLAAGTYSVVVKDANTCTYTTSVTITDTPGPTAVATTIVNATCGSANGSVTIGTVTGGTAPSTYSFNGSPFTATTNYTGLIAGTYPIIVKDANGCTFNTTVTITNAAGPTAVATTIANTTCGAANGSVTIGTVTGGTAPYTYSFNASSFTATTSYTSLIAGSYAIIVKDANGCTFNTTVTITNTSGPTAIATTINDAACGASDGDVTLGTVTGGTAPYTYDFNNLGYSAITAYTGLAAGSYTLKVKDANGCIFSTTVSISNASGVTAVATTVVNETCGASNGSVTIGTVTGGTSPFSYDFNGLGYSATTSYTGLAAGSYTVNVKDANGCIYSTTVAITNAGGPTAVATTVVNETCDASNGSVTLGTVTSGTAPYTYNFNNAGFAGATTYTGLPAGCYPLEIKDTNGCTFLTSICLTNSNGPTAVATTFSNETCSASNGSITLGAVTGGTAPYTYNFNSSGFQVSTFFNGLTAGCYSIEVKDANGCIYTTSVCLTDSPGPTAIATTIVNAACSANNGSVTLGAVTGGASPYLYDFNNLGYSATTSYSGLTAGSYVVNVKDANGCIFTTTVSVSNAGGPTAIATTITDESCGNANGCIAITGVTGGTAPYSYEFNGAGFTGTTNYCGLAAGTYTIIVKDANGCTYTTSVTVNSTPAPTASISYAGTPFTSTDASSQPVTLTGTGAYMGGTFTAAPAGLTLDTATGDIIASTSTPGCYTVTYTIAPSGGCPSVTATTNICITTLATDSFVNNLFSAYPNPTTGLLFVALKDVSTNIDLIIVTDVLGKTIQTEKINTPNTTVDLSRLSNGLYFVKVKSGELEKVLKVIKQ
ncbi:MAG: M43 family zinc metalloprotease [Bacteroidota bacterium]